MANIGINQDRATHALISSRATHALISYRAIVGGLLISMFTMLGFIGLGMAFGGMGINEETNAQSVGYFSGTWFIISVIFSLFFGSYCASRFSKYRSGKIGSLQGLVIASLFIGSLFYGSLSFLGAAAPTLGNVFLKSFGDVQNGEYQLSMSKSLGVLAEDSLGDLTLRSDLQVVSEGIGARLIRGDTESAKNYLSRQANITSVEAGARIEELKFQFEKYLTDLKVLSADAMRSAGWSIFMLVILGAIASVGGGALGSVANFRKPLMIQAEDFYPPGEPV